MQGEMRPILDRHVAATLAPVLLLAAGAVSGPFALAAALYLGVLAVVLDGAADEVFAQPSPTWLGRRLPVVLGLAHMPVLALGVAAVAGATGLGAWGRVAAFAGFGLYLGQVSVPAAHELIHRPDRARFRLGRAVFTSLLVGHHVSAHRLVHHVHVATHADPNTARRGEGFFRFAARASIGSFRAGRRAEARRGSRAYMLYIGGGLVAIGASAAAFGPAGALACVGLAAYAQAQLLMSDYVQHYGLSRVTLPDGRIEPVTAAHAWDAPGGFSALLMLNAPRHGDHHANPGREFHALATGDAPRLPHGLPAMAALALCPPLWRRRMDPRLPAKGFRSDGKAPISAVPA